MRININECIYKIGRLYLENNNILNEYLKLLDLQYQYLSGNDFTQIVLGLTNNNVLEISKINLKNCMESKLKSELLKLIENAIENKTRQITLEDTKILDAATKEVDILLIKGMAISRYYPEKYSRNQGDIDILVKNSKDLGVIIKNLEKRYYFEKLKLHFLYNNQITSTIDLIPLKTKLDPYIDVHLTPYYMWGAVAYDSNIWERSERINNFFIPSIEDTIVMLCAHLSNQWMYRMRDINDLFCLISKNNINWNIVEKQVKMLSLESLMNILIHEVINIYGNDLSESKIGMLKKLVNKLNIREKLFLNKNFGKENHFGSFLIEIKFVYSYYRRVFNLKKSLYHTFKNTYCMIVYDNRAFSTRNILKTKKENEVYVLKRVESNIDISTQKNLDKNISICNLNTKNEFIKTDFGNWKQVPYHQ